PTAVSPSKDLPTICFPATDICLDFVRFNMWNKVRERYYIAYVEIEQPLEAVVAPDGYTGVAVVLRFRSRPVGFFMQGGAGIAADELATAISRHAGKQILSEKVYADLRGSLDTSPFP